MKFRQALNIVPKRVRTWATAVLFCAMLIGLVVGFIEGRADSRIAVHSAYSPAQESIVGLGAGLFWGGLAAAYLLATGYVYGDARRRNMPPIPWMLAVIFVPNLLGFLLYFVLRRPITSPCRQCAQAITADQRFCSWCGCKGPSVPTSEGSSYFGPSPTAMT